MWGSAPTSVFGGPHPGSSHCSLDGPFPQAKGSFPPRPLLRTTFPQMPPLALFARLREGAGPGWWGGEGSYLAQGGGGGGALQAALGARPTSGGHLAKFKSACTVRSEGWITDLKFLTD